MHHSVLQLVGTHGAPPTVVRPAKAVEPTPPTTGRETTMKKTSSSFLIETISNRNRIALPVKGREGGISSRGLYHGLIISSAIATTRHEQKLTRLAEIAYGQRNISALERLSTELCSLPSDSARDAGIYYAAILAKREGRLDYARAILESLIDSLTFGARAIQALGALYYDSGNAHQALPLFAEAARSSDLFAKFGALIQSSAIKSQAGEHKQALNDLETLWPLVRVVSITHSHLFYTYQNELAYELAQVGRLEEAAKHSAIACASPVASAYSEWQETRDEIAVSLAQLEQRSLIITATVSVETVCPRPRQKRERRAVAIVARSIYARPVRRRLQGSTIAPASVVIFDCASSLIQSRVSVRTPIHAPPFTLEA